jgi:hypothetical protein
VLPNDQRLPVVERVCLVNACRMIIRISSFHSTEVEVEVEGACPSVFDGFDRRDRYTWVYSYEYRYYYVHTIDGTHAMLQ